jgi:hypothetical protein
LPQALRDRVAGYCPVPCGDARTVEGDFPSTVLRFDNDSATTEEHVVNVATASRVATVRDDGCTVGFPPLVQGFRYEPFGVASDSGPPRSCLVWGASELAEGDAYNNECRSGNPGTGQLVDASTGSANSCADCPLCELPLTRLAQEQVRVSTRSSVDAQTRDTGRLT